MAAIVELGDGLKVSALGFGGMSLTDVYGAVTDDDALRYTPHHQTCPHAAEWHAATHPKP